MKSITNLSKFSLIGHVSKTDCENDKFVKLVFIVSKVVFIVSKVVFI
jgi:hypothetical protein